MSIGSGSGTEYDTARGRDFPGIRQFTIFLENRVGQLLELGKRFEGTGKTLMQLFAQSTAKTAGR